MDFFDIHTHKLNNGIQIYNCPTWEDVYKIDKGLFSLGIHPWYINDQWEYDFEKIRLNAENKNCVAIGECGLDKLSDKDYSTQLQIFEEHIALAIQLNKPLIVHCVKAHQDCMEMLKNINIPVIFHGFNKSIELAEELINKEFFLSLNDSFFKVKRSKKISGDYLSKIFLETDNSTYTIEEIYRMASEYFGIDINTLSLQIQKNYELIFSGKGR